jgi:hypothetical protein
LGTGRTLKFDLKKHKTFYTSANVPTCLKLRCDRTKHSARECSIACPKGTQTHLRASVSLKIFPEVKTLHPVLKGIEEKMKVKVAVQRRDGKKRKMEGNAGFRGGQGDNCPGHSHRRGHPNRKRATTQVVNELFFS